jgi:hypothetical protein
MLKFVARENIPAQAKAWTGHPLESGYSESYCGVLTTGFTFAVSVGRVGCAWKKSWS